MNTTTLNMTTLDGNVIIKKGGGGTPTPPSGGESGGSSWKYFRLNEGWKQGMGGYILPYAYLIGKYTLDSEKRIGSSGMIVIQFDGNLDALEQVGIDVNTPFIKMSQGDPVISFTEMINACVADMGGTIEEALSTFGLTEITKEQFYSLD